MAAVAWPAFNVNGVISASLAVAIYWGPLGVRRYALLTQTHLGTNSIIKMAISAKIYHGEWPVRSSQSVYPEWIA